MPDLRNRHGDPTGAIYGVLNMLRKLRHDYPADYSLCVFDAKGKTFRDDWYPEYKAHRPAMPADLARQIEPLHQAIAASGWNLMMMEGVEADDVIGTLVQQAAHDGAHSIVATGDKDLTQLVNAHVTLVNTMSNETLDVPGVNAKFGVPPERIVDYLTLTGDAVDNVPGVEKVGPKTAVKWLNQYGTLDNVMQHADEIGGVVGENLRKALDWLPQARRLLTVKCDVAVPLAYTGLVPPPADQERLRSLFERFEFKSWLREALPPLIAGARPVLGTSKEEEEILPLMIYSATNPPHRRRALRNYPHRRPARPWLEKLLAAELAAWIPKLPAST
jgi:DNA polymerase-1